jgi:Flp pilus assembly protein TadD
MTQARRFSWTRTAAGPLCLIAAALLLSGCSAPNVRPEDAPMAADLAFPGRGEARCGEEHAPHEVVLHLQLIEDMQRQGLYHAALAHLDALGEAGAELPRARFLRAESLRRAGDPAQAHALFQGLTTSCLAGLGYHGLARLDVDAGRTAEALRQFAAAEHERPTDPRIRNDHGYALLLAGHTREARHQFQTAWELGGGERATANLLLALLVAGEEHEAEALAERVGLPSNDMKRLRGDAEKLRGQQQRPEAQP